MNTSNIKKYTPKVGQDFIAIMTKQAVMAKGCEPMEIQGCLDHGRRVLSTASGEAGTPQIQDGCLDIEGGDYNPFLNINLFLEQ